LVLNAITAEDDLIDDLVNAPTLTNVYSGHLHRSPNRSTGPPSGTDPSADHALTPADTPPGPP